MGFDLQGYEPVADRLSRFWADNPNGRVVTELLSSIEQLSSDGVLIRASVWRDASDERPTATGYAHEHVSARGVNATSAVENCETSAVGRALANLNYAPKGAAARPSREEMAATQVDDGPPPDRHLLNVAFALWGDLGYSGDANRETRLSVMSKMLGRTIATTNDLTSSELRVVIKGLRKRQAGQA